MQTENNTPCHELNYPATVSISQDVQNFSDLDQFLVMVPKSSYIHNVLRHFSRRMLHNKHKKFKLDSANELFGT